MRIFFVSLGCDKNLVDSEHMLSYLTNAGHEIVDDESLAEVIIVNSCCFIRDALEESIQNVIDLAAMKQEGCCKSLIVTGCMAQRYADEIQTEIPEVDAVIGTNSIDDILEAIDKTVSGENYISLKSFEGLPKVEGRAVTTGGHYEYLKIAEGCDKYCAYCVIPYIRGRYRSIPMEEILEEAKFLVDEGARELILVAQETTLYGTDLYGRKMLPELLHRLSEIEDLKWIRLLYCYPEEITDELIEEMASNSKVCHYIDMPIQSGSDAILKRMGRRTDSAAIREITGRLRQRIPDICIRTTILCGFPGETPQMHEETLSLIRDMKYDRLGAFAYSKEEGTRAYDMDGQIDEDVKSSRVEDVMLLQQDIVFGRNENLAGRSLEVFIEGRMTEEENLYAGRSYMDAPGVDGLVFVKCPYELVSGTIVRVRITAAREYDLIGEIIE